MSDPRILYRQLKTAYDALEDNPGERKDITVNQLLALMFVAAHPGCSHGQIQDALGMNQPTAFRSANKWVEGVSVFPFIRADVDPADKRMRILTLTPLGQRFVNHTVAGGVSAKPPR